MSVPTIQTVKERVVIEGILDEFSVFVTDFYDELNETSETICYQEFGSTDLKDIQKLRTLIGKRFYAVSYAGRHLLHHIAPAQIQR